MPSRVCISVVVLSLTAVLVFSTETNACISFKYDIKRSASAENLNLTCRLTECEESLHLEGQSVKIFKFKDGGNFLLASIERIKNLANGTRALGNGTAVSGDLKGKDKAFLSIVWNRSGKDLEVQYSCVVDAMNENGSRRAFAVKVKVVADKQDETHPEEKPKPTQTSEEEPCNNTQILEAKIQAMQQELAEATVRNEQLVVRMKEKIQALQQKLAEKAWRNYQLVGIFFEAPLYHDSKKYYLSLLSDLDVEDGDAACSIVGGYLAEVNDAREYRAIVRYIKSHNAAGALISGNGDAKQGPWVYHRSQKPVEYFNWDKWESRGVNGRENCIAICIENDELMNAVTCKGNPDRYPFICEVDK